MGCCETDGFKGLHGLARGKPLYARPLGRRTVIKGAAALAGTGALVMGHSSKSVAKNRAVQLAFCSQLLCVTPYEVTRDGRFFSDEGLDVELVYMRGSSVAMQALVGGAVDYAATSFEDVLLAADRGVDLKRFVSTSLGSLAALAIAPNRAAEITSFKDLEGRTFGTDALGSIG